MLYNIHSIFMRMSLNPCYSWRNISPIFDQFTCGGYGFCGDYVLGTCLNIFHRLVFPTSKTALHPGPVYRRWVGELRSPAFSKAVHVKIALGLALARPQSVLWP